LGRDSEKNGFEIIITSPVNYNELVAEIHYKGKFVALISQEKGKGQFDLELPEKDIDESMIAHKVDLEGFTRAMELACKRLQGRNQSKKAK